MGMRKVAVFLRKMAFYRIIKCVIIVNKWPHCLRYLRDINYEFKGTR